MEKLKTDFPIPIYLEKDIDAYIDAVNRKDLAWDCYYNEVQSSLRRAYGDYALDEDQCRILRDWYL